CASSPASARCSLPGAASPRTPGSSRTTRQTRWQGRSVMPDIDEDVMRELMFRSTADLHARPAATAAALKRQRQRQLRTRVLAVTGVAAAAGLAAGVIVIPSGGQPAVPGSVGAAQ